MHSWVRLLRSSWPIACVNRKPSPQVAPLEMLSWVLVVVASGLWCSHTGGIGGSLEALVRALSLAASGSAWELAYNAPLVESLGIGQIRLRHVWGTSGEA